MEDSQPAPVTEAKPVRKRSAVERLIVWGGILVLLIVLGVEWMSSKDYNESFRVIDATFKDRGGEAPGKKYLLTDIEKKVQGFPFRSDETTETKGLPLGGKEGAVKKQRRIVYTWPSLFKTYKLAVIIDDAGNAYYVEVLIPGV